MIGCLTAAPAAAWCNPRVSQAVDGVFNRHLVGLGHFVVGFDEALQRGQMAVQKLVYQGVPLFARRVVQETF